MFQSSRSIYYSSIMISNQHQHQGTTVHTPSHTLTRDIKRLFMFETSTVILIINCIVYMYVLKPISIAKEERFLYKNALMYYTIIFYSVRSFSIFYYSAPYLHVFARFSE